MILLSACLHAQTFRTIYYQPDDTAFPNPERGFYRPSETHTPNYRILEEANLENQRAEGMSLHLRSFYLEDFIHKPISEEYLLNMQRDFTIARKAGVKLIVRFAYTKRSTAPHLDAPLEQVLSHIDQLAPVLNQNLDVIATIQAGFIGAWGEWYYTDYYDDFEDRRTLVNHFLASVNYRTLQIRTPRYKTALTGSTVALTDAEAYGDSPKARLGHFNDCFLASPSDVGTYSSDMEAEKAFMEQDTKYLPMGGETCGIYHPLSQCPNAMDEMKRFHWSFINSAYHQGVLGEWETDHCYMEIFNKLGYRYRLVSARLQEAAKPGGSVELAAKIWNDGWANPYNPRQIEIVLKNEISGKEYIFPLSDDPRRWPLADTIDVAISAGLPSSMEEGTYTAYLNFPDPELRLYGNPNYSIRLANPGVWVDSTGYNSLGHDLVVSHATALPDYTGASFFAARANSTVSLAVPSPVRATSYGNNIILYWGITDSGPFRRIERSENGGEFQEIAFVPGSTFSWVDDELKANTSYAYRAYAYDGSGVSDFTPELHITTKSSAPPYYTFVTDGEDDEWEAVRPIASVFSTPQGISHSLRMFADTDSLNALLEGGPYTKCRIFLDTDNNADTGIRRDTWQNNGFDYLISNDSLFQAQQGSWVFVAPATVRAAGELHETSIALGHLSNLGTNQHIKTAVETESADGVLVNLPFAGQQPLSFIRILAASAPSGLTVGNSAESPETRLIIQWEACDRCLGYVLERSIDNEVFETLDSVQSVNIYRDDGLNPDETYYYRIAAYNKAGPSPYSATISGKTRLITALSDALSGDESSVHASVYPNPVEDLLMIAGHVYQSQSITTELHDLQGRLLKRNDYPVLSPGAYSFSLGMKDVGQGMYFLRVIFKRQTFTFKVIKS